jgi:hypothetical protein
MLGHSHSLLFPPFFHLSLFSFLFFHLPFSPLFFSFFFFFYFCFLSFFHLPLSIFFGKIEPTPALVWMDHVMRCPPFSPTLGLFCLRTPKIKCLTSVSPLECVPSPKRVPSVQLMQLPCFRASHDLHSF